MRLAFPNKLFEAAYFGVPLIVAEHTAVACRVKELGVGVAVDPLRPAFLDDLPELLTTRRLHEMKVRALALSTDMLTESSTRLLEALAAITAPKARARGAPGTKQ